MDYRQRLADAAVADLRRQLGDDAVTQDGTWVQLDDSFRMARVIEAVMRVAFDDAALTALVAERLNPVGAHPRQMPDIANDLLRDIQGWILEQLDPLP